MKKLLFAFIALLALPFPSSAQQTIERLVGKYNDNSLIRKIDDGKWLVYSHDEFCHFSRVMDGDTMVDVLSLSEDLISVSDFEIYGERVYLCGLANNGNSYMAYFELSSFPYSPVSYVYLEGISTVIKLEVIPQKNGNTNPLCQVVITGEDGSGDGIIVDAVPTATGWDIYHIRPYHGEYVYPHYYDIAVLDDYVVFTFYDCRISREGDEKCRTGLLYFSMPVTPVTPLHGSSIQAKGVPYGTTEPFLIKRIGGNAFATATINIHKLGYMDENDIYVSRYIGLNAYGTAIIHLGYLYNRLKDMACDVGEEFLDETGIEVLIYYENNDSRENVVYRIVPSMFISSGVSWGHVYDADISSSLIYEGNYSNRYIVTISGDWAEHRLYLYRYDAGVYPIYCWSYYDRETDPLEKETKPIPFTMEYASKKGVLFIQIPETSETSILCICREY